MDSQLDRRPDISPTVLTASARQPTPPADRMGACLGHCVANKSSCLKRWRSTDENETELMTDEEEDDNPHRRKKKERKLIFRIIKFKRKNRKQFLDKFREHQDHNYSRLSRAPTAELTDIQLQSLDAQTLLATAAKDIATSNTFVPVAHTSSRTSSSLDLEWEHEYSHNHYSHRVLSRSWLFIDGAVTDTPADDGETSDDNKPLFSSPPSEDQCPQDVKLQNRPPSSVAKINSNQQPSVNFTRTSSRTSWSHISTPESLEWDIDEEQRNQMHLEDDNLDNETLELLHQIEMLKNKVLNETGDGLGGIGFSRNGDDRDS